MIVAQISKFLRSVVGGGLTFWCQGCKKAHTVWVGDGPGPQWGWNGDVDKPAFTPSVLVTVTQCLTDEQHAAWRRGEPLADPVPTRCHTFVGCNGAQPGEIVFLSDCTHALAGQTLPLAPLPPFMSSEA